jgi:transposase
VTWIMAVLVVSEMELSRLDTLQRIIERRLTCTAAAKLLGLSRRQVHRLVKAYRAQGPAALVSKRRGQPSNRRYPAELRHKALGLVREHYADFGPTLAAEKLAEHHDLRVSHETLRQWMIQDGLWLTRPERKKRIHQPRQRRDRSGELIQIDGCEHPWFEERGPTCTLLVFVDDATSKLMHLAFVASESTFDYFRATRAYLEAHGKPLAFYSDRHGIFRVNRKGALGGDGMTQFGRALHALNIEILCASSPEAINGSAVDPDPQGRRSSDRRGGGSSGRTRRCRTGWSRSCGWPGSRTGRRATRSCPASWRATMPGSPSRPRRRASMRTARWQRMTTWTPPCAGRKNGVSRSG